MVLQLLLVHVLNSFDDDVGRFTVGVLRSPILGIIIIIDVHIIIVDDLNDLGRGALAKFHVAKTHRVQLGLHLRVIHMATLRVVVVGGTLLIRIALAVLVSFRTPIPRINGAYGFGMQHVLL